MEFLAPTDDFIQDMLELWNVELGCDFPMISSLLRDNCFGDAPLFMEGSKLAWDRQRGRLAGMILAKRDGSTGRISVLLVRSGYRRRGLGSLLLSSAEQAFSAVGIDRIGLGAEERHFFPGVPAQYAAVKSWFEHRGYSRNGTVCDMLLSGVKAEVPTVEEADFQPLAPGDKEAFFGFLHDHFPGRWEHSARRYFLLGGTGEDYILAMRDGGIIGFCRISDRHSPAVVSSMYWSALLQGESGGIGPLGIASHQRGKGYGLGIVQAGMHALQQRGARHIVIDWTSHTDFYARLGFSVWKQYDTYVGSPIATCSRNHML